MTQQPRPRRATRLWLTRLDRRARHADLRARCRALLKVHAGQSPHHAAHEIGCHPATACRIVARFVAHGEGSVFDGGWSNGIRKVSPGVPAGIVETLQATPECQGFPRPTWTLDVLARVIAQKLGVRHGPAFAYLAANRLASYARYCSASASRSALIRCSPARSAIVRATRIARCTPRADMPPRSTASAARRRPAASSVQCSWSAGADSIALSRPRARCRARAAMTRSRTAALGSPAPASSNSSDVSAGTSICRSSRSSTGPLTRAACCWRSDGVHRHPRLGCPSHPHAQGFIAAMSSARAGE